jgi:RHS repeat-associated protein
MCTIPGTGNPSCGSSVGSQLNAGGSTGAGNPIDLTSGNKYQRESDIELPGVLALAFVRHYNSLSTRVGVLGRGWSHDYDTRLARHEQISEKAQTPYIEVTQGDGRIIQFAPYGADAEGVRRFASQPAGYGIIEERIGEIERLRGQRTGEPRRMSNDDPTVWSWSWPSGRRLEFDQRGLLKEIREPTGERLRPSFDRWRRLIAVTDAQGRTLSFRYWDHEAPRLEPYESNVTPAVGRGYPGRLQQVSLPDGSAIRYGYTAQGDLSDVRYGDGSLKRYEYGQAGGRARLSRIYERDGLLAAQFDYDEAGYAIHTTHALHVDEASLKYQWPKKPGEAGITWLTRADGERTEYHWQRSADGSAEITEAKGPGCRTCPPSNVRYERDPKNNVRAVVRLDAKGHPLERESQVRDALGRVTHQELAVFLNDRLQEPTSSEDLEYEGTGFFPVRILAPSVVPGKLRKLVLTYNGNGQLTELLDHGWNPAGENVSNPWIAQPAQIERRVRLSYNAEGRLTRIQGPRADVSEATELQYDADGRLKRIVYPDRSVQEVLSFDPLGMPQRIAQTGQPTLELTHDALGRLLKVAEIGVEDAQSIQYEYDTRGRLYGVTLPDGKKLRADYDPANRPTQMFDEASGVTAAVTYADGDGQIERQVIRDRNGQLLRTIAFSFDARHRLMAMRDGKNHSLATYGYEDSDELEQAQPTQLIDPSGLQTLLAYDRFGRVTREQSPDGGLQRFQYAPSGQLTLVEASNGAKTRYQYDDFGQVVREDSPDRGNTRYFHDSAGNLTAKVDARGVIVRYGYDAGNRLSWVRSRDGLTRFEYTGGRFTHLNGPWGEERYSYDLRGRLIAQLRILDGHTLTTGYRYDAQGRLGKKILPDGQVLEYHYDSAGQLQAIAQAHWWGETALIGTLPHTGLADQLTARAAERDQAVMGEEERAYGNGLVARAHVDTESGRVTSLITDGVEKLDYRYDDAGRISAIDSEWLDAALKTSHNRYQYDTAGRLIGAETPLGDFRYRYDSNGNRVADSADETSPGYAYSDGSNRLVRAGKVEYQYDQTGNPLHVGARQYEYDSSGRPTNLYVNGTLLAQYAYNSWGERIRKVVYSGSGRRVTYYLYDGHQLTAEVDEAGHVTRQYLYLGYTPLVVLVGTEPYFIHDDHLGAPHAVTDHDRKVVWRAEYTPFGEARVDQDPQRTGSVFTLNLRLPGQYADAESGTYYNYLRDYDPRLGRYVESDPIGLHGGANTYAYGADNPLSGRDPSGTAFIAGQEPWLVGSQVHYQVALYFRGIGDGWGGGDGRFGTWVGGEYPDVYNAPGSNAETEVANGINNVKGDVWELKPETWRTGSNRQQALTQIKKYAKKVNTRGCWEPGSSAEVVDMLPPQGLPIIIAGNWARATFSPDTDDSSGLFFYEVQRNPVTVPVPDPVYKPNPVRQDTKQPTVETALDSLSRFLKDDTTMSTFLILAFIALFAAVIIGLIATFGGGVGAAAAAVVAVIAVAIARIKQGVESASAVLGEILGRTPPGA